MSKTVAKLIVDSLVAKFYIHPVPKSLSQSAAICQHVQSFSANPLVQYRHARDPNTGTRLNSFRVIFNDPISSAAKSTLPETVPNEGKSKIISRLVNQTPFHKISKQFQAQAKIVLAQNRTTSAQSILASIPKFTYTPDDVPSKPSAHSSVQISEPATQLELDLLGLTQIVLDADNNVIPLHEYLDLMYMTKDSSSLEDCTPFTLDLALMSRDSDVITYASKNSLMDHFKIDRKQPFEERWRALERLQAEKMHGFTGKFGTE